MTGLFRPHIHNAPDSVDAALEASAEGITVASLAVLYSAARDIGRRLLDAVDPSLFDAGHIRPSSRVTTSRTGPTITCCAC